MLAFLSNSKLPRIAALSFAAISIAFPSSSIVLPESAREEQGETAIAQNDLATELLAAMNRLQVQLSAPVEENASLMQASERLQSLLQDTLQGAPLAITPELSGESERARNAIAARLERQDAPLAPELRQKLVTLRQSLGTLFSNNPYSLSPEILENSPVLQRWGKEVPDVLEDIHRDPAFRTRVRLGYSHYPSTDGKGGFNVGVEDILLGRSGFTVSANTDRSFNGDRATAGVDLNYYLFPLGSYVNIAPVVGYRNITTGSYWTDGVTVGGKVILPLSRTGAADITFSQLFVSPGSANEVGITTLSAGYAFTPHLRLSTDIQKQNSVAEKDSRVGIVLEWMP